MYKRQVQDTLNQSLTRNDEQLRGVNQRFETLSSTLNTSLNELRKQVDDDLKVLNKDNEAKLEKIRETVEEKLQNTLTSKVGESFSQAVSYTHLSLEQRVAHIHGELFETFLKCLAVCIGEKCPAAVGVGSDSNDIIRGN